MTIEFTDKKTLFLFKDGHLKTNSTPINSDFKLFYSDVIYKEKLTEFIKTANFKLFMDAQVKMKRGFTTRMYYICTSNLEGLSIIYQKSESDVPEYQNIQGFTRFLYCAPNIFIDVIKYLKELNGNTGGNM